MLIGDEVLGDEVSPAVGLPRYEVESVRNMLTDVSLNEVVCSRVHKLIQVF